MKGGEAGESESAGKRFAGFDFAGQDRALIRIWPPIYLMIVDDHMLHSI